MFKKILKNFRLHLILIAMVMLFITPLYTKAQVLSLEKESFVIANLGDLMLAITNFLLELGWIVAAIMIMVSGVRYMLSAGNSDARGKAVKSLYTSVIGFVIILTFWAFFNFFTAFIEVPDVEQPQQTQGEQSSNPITPTSPSKVSTPSSPSGGGGGW